VVIFASGDAGVVGPAPGGENDLVNAGLISRYETTDGQRFIWARGDLSQYLSTKSLDGSDETLNACAFAAGQVTTVVEVDADQYQVAAYYGGAENTRVQGVYGYLGSDVPAEPDVTIQEFGNDGAGVYVIWEVTANPNETFTILTTQVGPVNAVISGIFVDAGPATSVEASDKLIDTWGNIKSMR